MKYLSTYKLFESQTELTPEQEDFLYKYTKGTESYWSYDPQTGLVNVKGKSGEVEFDCGNQELKTLSGIKFGRVDGNFYCNDNELKTLEGAPQKVGGNFSCRDNKLKTLKGAPLEVGGDFYCYSNNLTTLKEAPQKVGGDFYCNGNELKTLKEAPQKVGVNFSCRNNKLTTLEGAPLEVGGNFSCRDNKLTTLKGAPLEVGGYFSCDAFELKKGEWNQEGWLEVLKKGSPEAQFLILTLLNPEAINKEIQKDPAGMMIKLKGILNLTVFKETRSKLVWPKDSAGDADLLGDIVELGF